ncbi:MAG: tetratricopeptide repeat protein [Lachnospiraceae bacterium]|nr:tetratricopeptide repeat protein [Lachnospiraceae bacterium]
MRLEKVKLLFLCAALTCSCVMSACGAKTAEDTTEESAAMESTEEGAIAPLADGGSTAESESMTESEEVSMEQVETDYVTAGMEAIEAQDYTSAQSYFKQALIAGEDERLILRGQGIAYLGAADYESAIAAFEKCLQVSSMLIDDLDIDVNYYLATAYDKAGNPAEAEAIYTAILQVRSNDIDSKYMRGMVRLEQGLFDTAKADFDEVLAKESTNYDLLLTIFQALQNYGYQSAGEEYLSAALSAGEESISAYDRGRLYYYLGEYEQARNALLEVTGNDNPDVTFYLGKSWEALGEYNYAASVYQTYLKSGESDARIYNELALCMIRLEDYDSALSAVESGLALEDTSMRQSLLFNQFVIYEYRGDFATAKDLVQEYLTSYPDDTAAQREAIFLSSRS